MTEREDELILEMIVAEERQRVAHQEGVQGSETDDSETPDRLVYKQQEGEEDFITFIEERDVTLRPGVWNEPASVDDLDDLHELPIRGSGNLENFLIVADDPQFRVRVNVDDHEVIDDEFNFIESISNELTKISAYKDLDDRHIVSVSNYEFDERVNVLIRPTADPINFEVIRVEVERDE